MKKYLTELLFLLLLLCVCYIGCEWNNHRGVESKQPVIKTEVSKGKDSTTVFEKQVRDSVDNPIPKSTYAFTPTVIHDTIHDTVWCDSIRVYVYDNDTLRVVDSIQGRLIKQSVLYKMYNTNTTRVDTFKYFIPSSPRAIIAPFVDLSTSPSIGLLVGKGRFLGGAKVNQQGNWSVVAGYNLLR